MKVLIIGGTGNISGGIGRALVKRDVELTLFTRGQKELRLGTDDVKQIHGDRKDFDAFEKQMADAGEFDVVIDMICFKPDEAESDIRAFAGRTKQLIFCSTVNVYDRPPSRWPTPEDEPRNPPEDYGQLKAKCEDLFWQAEKEGKFRFTSFRPAHTYSDHFAFARSLGKRTTWIDRLRRGLPIVCHGDGTSIWAMCHSDDLGEAVANACLNEVAYGKAYNISSDQKVCWNFIYEHAAKCAGGPPPDLVYIPSAVLWEVAQGMGRPAYINFQYNSWMDNSAAKRDLNYVEKVDWRDGVERNFRFLDENGLIETSGDDDPEALLIEQWRKAMAQFADGCAGIESIK